MTKTQCPDCKRDIRVKTDGDLYKHPCAETIASDNRAEEHAILRARSIRALSDPAPTVDAMDDECTHPNGFTEHGCPCGASRPDDEAPDDLPPLGPWFGAEGTFRCESCEDVIYEGDRIRADGTGGYECGACGGDPEPMTDTDAWDNPSRPHDWQDAEQDWQAQASAAAKRAMRYTDPGTLYLSPALVFAPEDNDAADALMTAALDGLRPTDGAPAPRVVIGDPSDPFDAPSQDDPFDVPGEAQPKLNVSGQPEARRDWQKRYIVVDPELGDFRRAKNGNPQGLTRATTFNKAASSTIRLGEWKARNIVIGASRSPDILLGAHGLTDANGRDELNRIAARLEEVAGAKVGSELGTYLHEFTELMDAGLKRADDAPTRFRESLRLYEIALADAGLEPVPGLIERTTMIREYGGIVGTFDRIFYHRPSGQYVIGDLKTGKTMDYARTETDTQMWIYAHGVNQNGVYDWNTDTWGRAWESREHLDGPIKVSEDVGVIIHMPVQDKLAGQVILEAADLNAGWRHADLCHANRSAAKPKSRPWSEWAPCTVEYTPPARDWEPLFVSACTSERATALWREAKAEGIEGVRLNELIELARESIRQASARG